MEVSSQKYNIDDLVREFIDDVMNEKFNYNIALKVLLSSLLSQRRSRYFCGAGNDQISIDTNGDIWPCQLFNNKDRYKMGNIYESQKNIENSIEKARGKINVINREIHEDCSNCIASFWCKRCVGETLIRGGNLFVEKSYCKDLRILTEKILNKMIFLLKNNKYEEFAEKFESIYALEMS